MTTIRDKFEKSRGHIAKSKAAHDIEDEFADFPMAPALPGTEAFIGTPVRRVFVNPNTPLMELRNRAASVRAALDASMPRPPIVSCDIDGRELALAEEAALTYEPTGRDIMHVLGNIANNMVVKDDLRVEITEALHPVHAHMDSINAKSERALDETRVLNERLALIERDKLSDGDRVANLEAQIRYLKAQLSGGSNSN